MFRQLIACHPQGALVVLAKITIKHEHSIVVMGVAAYLIQEETTPFTILECSCFIKILARTTSPP
jgi:hypothetical protein